PSIMAPAPPHIYSLSLHDALPILDVALDGHGTLAVAVLLRGERHALHFDGAHFLLADERMRSAEPFELHALGLGMCDFARGTGQDRKSTRLNSSHVKISYAVFCLK